MQAARYADSIESLVRNNIQKMKIDMANEVIDAGRFDMKTTMGERRQTLEDMLQVSAKLFFTEWPNLFHSVCESVGGVATLRRGQTRQRPPFYVLYSGKLCLCID